MGQLFFKTLRIEVETQEGQFYVQLDFKLRGLNLIRGDNTTGKTTCVNALIYALGLEQLLSANNETGPDVLVLALKDHIEWKGKRYQVISSAVFLELMNHKNEPVTLKRQIVGDIGFNSILVINGHSITNPITSYKTRPYLANNQNGAYQREDGFPVFMSKYLEIELPIVKRFKKDDYGKNISSPLYFDCILPLMFIEQRRGWTDIQATFPKFYGIMDVVKNSLEFLMKLDIVENRKKKDELAEELQVLETQWNQSERLMKFNCETLGGFLNSFQKKIPNEWSIPNAPYITFLRDKEVQTHLEDEIQNIQEQLLKIDDAPKAKAEIEKYRTDLDSLTKRLYDEIEKLKLYKFEAFEEQRNIDILQHKISELKRDRKKNIDIQKLNSFNKIEPGSIDFTRCPYCNQEISDVLIEGEKPNFQAMSIEENIKAIEQQIKTAQLLLKKSKGDVDLRGLIVFNQNKNVETIRTQIRGIENQLVESTKLPDITDLRKKVELENRLVELQRLSRTYDGFIKEIKSIIKNYSLIKAKLLKIPDELFSEDDKRKLESLAEFYRSNISRQSVATRLHSKWMC